MRWNLSIVLICISFLAKDVENFFICLLVVCISENYVFNSFDHLLNRLFILLISCLLYLFWMLIPSQKNTWKRFSPIL
jgi:hypothetical protein